MFEVEPIITTMSSSSNGVVQAVSRADVPPCIGEGCWRRLQDDTTTNSSPFQGTLTLLKGNTLNANSDVDEEIVKQFFLDAMNNNDSNNELLVELEGLLGDWMVVEYVPITSDATAGVVEEEDGNEGVDDTAAVTATTTTTVVDGDGSLPTTGISSNEQSSSSPLSSGTSPALPGATTSVVNTPSSPADEQPEVNLKEEEPQTPTESTDKTVVDLGPNSDDNTLGIVLGVVGVCLAAFLIVGFAYRHKKKRDSRDPDFIGDIRLEHDENNRPTVTVSQWASGLLPHRGGKASTATTTAPSGVEVKEIDRVLADLNSDDGSYATTSSNADTSCYSGYSGMTGISDLNYQPKNDSKNNNATAEGTSTRKSSLEKVEEMKPSISFLDQSRTGSNLSYSNLGGTSQSMRREESFENDYRDKSAMATLNLRKDMLDVDVAEDENARTISTSKNTEMMAQQREVEKANIKAKKMKKRMKSVSPPSRKKEGIRETIRSLSPSRSTEEKVTDESQDILLPSKVEKSDDLEIV